MAASLPHDALVTVLRQIHDGVDARCLGRHQGPYPDLAALANGDA